MVYHLGGKVTFWQDLSGTIEENLDHYCAGTHFSGIVPTVPTQIFVVEDAQSLTTRRVPGVPTVPVRWVHPWTSAPG
jgi:hypothetical protein